MAPSEAEQFVRAVQASMRRPPGASRVSRDRWPGSWSIGTSAPMVAEVRASAVRLAPSFPGVRVFEDETSPQAVGTGWRIVAVPREDAVGVEATGVAGETLALAAVGVLALGTALARRGSRAMDKATAKYAVGWLTWSQVERIVSRHGHRVFGGESLAALRALLAKDLVTGAITPEEVANPYRFNYLVTISAGPLMVVRTPEPMPKWKDVLRAMTSVMQSHGFRLKDLWSLENILAGTQTSDIDARDAENAAAFAGDPTKLKAFHLYDWQDGAFVLVREKLA